MEKKFVLFECLYNRICEREIDLEWEIFEFYKRVIELEYDF